MLPSFLRFRRTHSTASALGRKRWVVSGRTRYRQAARCNILRAATLTKKRERPLIRKLVIAVVVLAIVVLAGAGWLYWASRRVPEFYTTALADDPVELKRDSDALLRQASNLVNDARKTGRWEATFTTAEINGWLAVDLVENHGGAIPAEFHHPRVALAPDSASLGVQYDGPDASTVIWVEGDMYVTAPNVVALRIRKARAGAVPLPMNELIDRLARAAKDLNLQLDQSQVDGDPLLLLTLPPSRDENDDELRLEKLELREGALYVAGRTESTRAKPIKSGPPKIDD